MSKIKFGLMMGENRAKFHQNRKTGVVSFPRTFVRKVEWSKWTLHADVDLFWNLCRPMWTEMVKLLQAEVDPPIQYLKAYKSASALVFICNLYTTLMYSTAAVYIKRNFRVTGGIRFVSFWGGIKFEIN